MDDREMLRLAALAAGIALMRPADAPAHDHGAWINEKPHHVRWWNPLTNDGDALRLAVQLRIDVQWESMDWVSADNSGEPADTDPYAATRRAITRAAAMLGAQMEQGGGDA